MSWTSIITSGFIYAVIAFIAFLIVGGSGGFAALAGIGAVLKQIPAWFYITISIIWLASSMFGGNK